MEFDLLVEEVQNLEPRISKEQIDQWLQERRVAAAHVTGSQILDIARELAPAPLATTPRKGRNLASKKAEVATLKVNTPATGDRFQTQTATPNLTQIVEEVDAFTQGLNEQRDSFVEDQSTAIATHLGNTSRDIVAGVKAKLEVQGYDPELFRRAGSGFGAALFGSR